MKLVASLIVRNEFRRYLVPHIIHLREFCDEIRVLDDASDDGTREWLMHEIGHENVIWNPEPTFYEHEGRTRNALLDFTLRAEPTHILAIDADEFISDGPALRAFVYNEPRTPCFAMTMTEIWRAHPDALSVRTDGGWRPCRTTSLYRAPTPSEARHGSWRIRDLALACGREPVAVRQQRKFTETGVRVLHFGWANEATRQARYDRYVEHDGGRFHASAHLQSIMWDDRRVRTEHLSWPPALDEFKPRILRAAGYPDS